MQLISSARTFILYHQPLMAVPLICNYCSYGNTYSHTNIEMDTVGLNIVRVLGYYLQQEVKDDISYLLYQFYNKGCILK